VRLEELELILRRLSRCNDLHDGLQLRIYSCSLCQHMDDWIWCWRTCGAWGRLGRFLNGLRWWRSWLRRLLLVGGLTMAVVRVLVRVAMMRLVGIRPGSIHRLGGSPLWHRLVGFSRRIQSDGECVRFNDQLCLHVRRVLVGNIGVPAQLGKVLQQVFLPGVSHLVLFCAIRRLLGLVEVLVEDSEVDARHPYRPRPLQRCTEHAALLYILPFMCR
jgi:hypothetical protein